MFAGAVLVGFEERNEYLFFWLGGALFVVGSIADILDGALARAGGKGTVVRRIPRLDLRPAGRGGDAHRDRPRFMRDANEVALVRRSRP